MNCVVLYTSMFFARVNKRRLEKKRSHFGARLTFSHLQMVCSAAGLGQAMPLNAMLVLRVLLLGLLPFQRAEGSHILHGIQTALGAAVSAGDASQAPLPDARTCLRAGSCPGTRCSPRAPHQSHCEAG